MSSVPKSADGAHHLLEGSIFLHNPFLTTQSGINKHNVVYKNDYTPFFLKIY